MTAKCAPITSVSQSKGMVTMSLLLLACATAACSPEADNPAANTAVPAAAMTTEATAMPAPGAATPTVGGALKLSGAAGAEAIAATLAEAKRQGMTGVEVTQAQSFRVTEGGRDVATLLTGKGKMADATYAGCFIATQQGGETMVIPTLGYGEYEAQTCGGPTAVAILSSGSPVRIGVTFRGSSPSAGGTVPMVIEWDRADNTLLIDQALSSKAQDSGVTTVADLRPLVR